jgi:spore maturation protein CgeB
MIRGLKFAFFGPSIVSSFGNPVAGYLRGILRALHDRGHEITFYEPDAFGRQARRDIVDPPWAKVIVYPSDDERNLYPLYADAHNSDVIVKISHIGLFDSVMEKEILEMKRLGNLVFFWDIDPLNTLSRICLKTNDPFIGMIPKFDTILTFGGGDPIKKTYSEFHARRCVPIYNALDPHTYFPVESNPKFQADLAMINSTSVNRQLPSTDLFFNAASQLPESKFILAGTGWQGKPMPRNVYYIGPVYPRDHNAIHSTPKCLLYPVHAHAKLAPFPSAAIFQAVGAGGCVVTDHWTGLENFLEPETEILLAGTVEELTQKITDLSLERAREIGAAARKHLLAQHTCTHRADQIIQLIGLSGIVPKYAMT